MVGQARAGPGSISEIGAGFLRVGQGRAGQYFGNRGRFPQSRTGPGRFLYTSRQGRRSGPAVVADLDKGPGSIGALSG
jgi:hypothetical protein